MVSINKLLDVDKENSVQSHVHIHYIIQHNEGASSGSQTPQRSVYVPPFIFQSSGN
jgi:hypothetical protein